MLNIIGKFFGNSNKRKLKKYNHLVEQVNSLETNYLKLSDEKLKEESLKLRERAQNGESIESLLPESFAITREAAKRALGERHYDVQLIGGAVMNDGNIAEMRTGEGKTLVATLSAYLNALSGKGVHVVTVNDYLAKRDSEWMSKVFNALGLTVGCLQASMSHDERKEAYAADITYGANNEFGFDYLRDNLKMTLDEQVQRPFNFAIVDEVDSILIDEARTPLIISGPAEKNAEVYNIIDKLIPLLKEEDYELDEKNKSASLTEAGNEHVEKIMHEKGLIAKESNLFDLENIAIIHNVQQALRAHKAYKKDVDYIVKEGKVMIIDEFTGRIMDGRRYSEGLHQALEAKEGVEIENENQTLASITYQNYFRMYPKLSGMTGTALTEAEEFLEIYNLDVIDIPTNKPIARIDENDIIYGTAKEKFEAIVGRIKEAHNAKQPVLVGTVSIEKSELISKFLKKEKIPHNVLNARHHDKEAEIIAQAGQPGKVTVATNMAGRGTDIKLGGNFSKLLEEKLSKLGGNPTETAIKKATSEVEKKHAEDEKLVKESGGLLVLGTERHESRRIDNQLRGRSGRQGDPGNTVFYLSLEDDLMRIFGSEKITGVLQKLGLKDGEAIVHPWISKSLENAQKKVESRNYDIRKNLLKFDNVINDQRRVIYEQRHDILENQEFSEVITSFAEEINETMISKYIPAGTYLEQWDIEALEHELYRIYGINAGLKAIAQKEGVANEELLKATNDSVHQKIKEKFDKYGEQMVNNALQYILIFSLDQLWKEHMHTLDTLRGSIGLRAYAQKNPLNDYKMEAFNLFTKLLDDYKVLVVERFAHLEVREESIQKAPVVNDGDTKEVNELSQDDLKDQKISRNSPCPCGSGRKYKHCHGKIA